MKWICGDDAEAKQLVAGLIEDMKATRRWTWATRPAAR